ncbi:MAG TPA: hypothetical protein VJ924_14595, partial [Alphaproteobacteria bacterium]|nr:hypothetical protein [Alphaproteobacteria bacterium]
SHQQIIRQNGSAGDGKQYHHIVEQHPRNVERFGPFEIHNNDNVIILPREVHESISGHYSSKPEGMEGKTVRDWLADKSYEAQYRYGIQQLREAGVLK